MRIFLLLVLFPILVFSQHNNYLIPDSIASSHANFKFTSTKQLALHLTKDLNDSLNKVRAIYVYLFQNIQYDYKALNTGRYINTEVDSKNRKIKNENNFIHSALIRKKGVCQDYAEVFKYMCSSAGIRSGIIIGWAKGLGWNSSHINSSSNHAWSYVILRNDTLLFDICWASTLREKEFYFCTVPAKLIYTHYSEIPCFQLLKRRIDKKEFILLPTVYPYYFITSNKNYLEEIKIALRKARVK
jgi:transglutaminase/protease-like cytokinesis protein 3